MVHNVDLIAINCKFKGAFTRRGHVSIFPLACDQTLNDVCITIYKDMIEIKYTYILVFDLYLSMGFFQFLNK